MKQFIKSIIRISIILLLLVLIPSVLYLQRDVYSDFGEEDNYSWKYFFQQLGDMSTKKLISSPNKYNSFIFGSSRATSVYACYLQEKIENSTFFHYSNWNESIGGIERKINLLDSLGYSIDNVVIYLDTDYTFADEGKCSPFDHYLLTNKSRNAYLASHFNSFFKNLTTDKIKILLGLQVHGEVFPNWLSDLETNDPNHFCSDSMISFYGNIDTSHSYIKGMDSLINSGFLYQRELEQNYKAKQISPEEQDILCNLKLLLEKHYSNYYIVVTPLYDQYKFAISDQKILSDCFGENIYDFSGINDITNDPYNYPDRKHFQPYISKNILDSILN